MNSATGFIAYYVPIENQESVATPVALWAPSIQTRYEKPIGNPYIAWVLDPRARAVNLIPADDLPGFIGVYPADPSQPAEVWERISSIATQIGMAADHLNEITADPEIHKP